MLLSDFITQLTRVTFLLIAVVTVWDLAAHRGRTRLDIALLFSSLALSVVITEFFQLTGLAQPAWVSRASTILIMFQPFLLVRLVSHFQLVSRRAQISNTIGVAISMGLILFEGQPLPGWATVVLVVYFVWAEAFASVAFIRGARRSAGPARWRQGLAAGGSGLLGAAIALAAVVVFLPVLKSLAGALTQFLALLSGLGYYLAFAPPRWLRAAWQYTELHYFLREFAGKDARARAAGILPYLCAAATRTVGASASLVVLWDEAEQTLTVAESDRPGWNGRPVLSDGPVRQVWIQRAPQAAVVRAQMAPEVQQMAADVGATALLATPIKTAERTWGVMVVLLQHPPIFPDDDLDVLLLYGEQTALALEQSALLNEQLGLVDDLRRRTEQLQAANGELEAFSYSVSHDLRAPLRHIEGFTDLLLRDEVTGKQRQHLQRIADSALRMGRLIDDLLAFSRMGRAELNQLPVPLDQVLLDARRELAGEADDREIEWVFQPLPVVPGDPSLLRQAMLNLLSNAVKYTRGRHPARIEVGAGPAADGQVVIHVKDNGVGFDMQYADKLFGVFQRLHHSDEFEGIGIGLATVRRVIHRHGGRTWAEGAPGQGAVFYFTLPAAPAVPQSHTNLPAEEATRHA